MVLLMTGKFQNDRTIQIRENRKNGFGTVSDPIFRPDFRGEGVSIGRNRWDCGVSGPFELSENRNGFLFTLLLTEIYVIGKRYYFLKIGPFRSITLEPEFS